MTSPKPWLTLLEVAVLAGVSERTIRRHIASGQLPARRTRGGLRVSELAARGWIEIHRKPITFTPVPNAYRFLPIAVYAAITGLTEREVRHQIDKKSDAGVAALATIRIGGRLVVAGDEVAAGLKSPNYLPGE